MTSTLRMFEKELKTVLNRTKGDTSQMGEHKHDNIWHRILPRPDDGIVAAPVPVADAKQQQHPGCLAAPGPPGPTACC